MTPPPLPPRGRRTLSASSCTARPEGHPPPCWPRAGLGTTGTAAVPGERPCRHRPRGPHRRGRHSPRWNPAPAAALTARRGSADAGQSRGWAVGLGGSPRAQTRRGARRASSGRGEGGWCGAGVGVALGAGPAAPPAPGPGAAFPTAAGRREAGGGALPEPHGGLEEEPLPRQQLRASFTPENRARRCLQPPHGAGQGAGPPTAPCRPPAHTGFRSLALARWAGPFPGAAQQHGHRTLLPTCGHVDGDKGPPVTGSEMLLAKDKCFLCAVCGSAGHSVPQPCHRAHQPTVTPGLCAWVLQARPTFPMGAAPPSPPRCAFLFSRAAEISWILPQDAPSECENSSSARSHGNCSLATAPYLLFSSLHSCARPPRAAHEATSSPAMGTGLPAPRPPYPL